jgi:hypothetical protein
MQGCGLISLWKPHRGAVQVNSRQERAVHLLEGIRRAVET